MWWAKVRAEAGQLWWAKEAGLPCVRGPRGHAAHSGRHAAAVGGRTSVQRAACEPRHWWKGLGPWGGGAGPACRPVYHMHSPTQTLCGTQVLVGVPPSGRPAGPLHHARFLSPHLLSHFLLVRSFSPSRSPSLALLSARSPFAPRHSLSSRHPHLSLPRLSLSVSLSLTLRLSVSPCLLLPVSRFPLATPRPSPTLSSFILLLPPPCHLLPIFCSPLANSFPTSSCSSLSPHLSLSSLSLPPPPPSVPLSLFRTVWSR